MKNRELFYWESALLEQPKEGEQVFVQYKTFEFEKIKYTTKKKDWFIKNVQCWLKQFKAQNI